MEADMENPSEFHRFHVDNVTESRFVLWNKKRKLQPDEFGLPISKHNCLNRSSIYGPGSPLGENPELVSINSLESVAKLDLIPNDGSELESANSNSILEETDSAMSMVGEANLEANYPKETLCTETTSLSNFLNGSLKKPQYSLSGLVMEKASSSKDELVVMGEEHMLSPHDSEAEALHNLEDHLLGFGNHPDNFFSEYEHSIYEHDVEKEFKDVMSFDGVNLVLSSGRWSVNQEADSSRRKPTIDQEFEELSLLGKNLREDEKSILFKPRPFGNGTDDDVYTGGSMDRNPSSHQPQELLQMHRRNMRGKETDIAVH